MKKKRILSLIFSCIITAAVFCACSMEIVNSDTGLQKKNTLTVHFLDVGQGDSVFIELPNGETMLIDTGENYHGEGIINYIEETGHEQIDYLIGTHPHSDHIGSMPYIVRHFPVKQIYMPKVSTSTGLFESLLKAIQSKNLTVKNGKAGVNIVKTNEFSADILAPVQLDEENLNNCSVVIKLTFGDTSFLFTGDAETEEFDTITADMRVNVLKAAHHGSHTSTTPSLLQQIQPEITVISCGKGNDYGHPHKEVLQYLKNAGSEVYRTDRDKTVVIISDGQELTVQTKNKSIVRASE